MEDWQLKLDRVNERGKHLLETGIWSDCQFLVGDGQHKKFSTHKMILSMSSPVFEAMFYGGLAEENDPIEIPDVQPEAFTAMLEYIYTDEINLTTIEQACELCYAAKKYMLPFLVNQCMSYIWKDVKYPMACRAYEFAKLFDEAHLMIRCMEIIAWNTTLVLNDRNFEDVEPSTLLAILDCEKLNIRSELELVLAIYKWAVHQCKQKGLETNKQENLRSVLGPALSKIRFLTLSPAEFASSPAIPELLTQDEAFALLMKISSPSTVVTVPDGFSVSTVARANSTQPTSLLDHTVYCCERTIVQHISIKNYSRMDSYVTFTVNKDIVLHGIMIPSQLKLDSEEESDVLQREELDENRVYCNTMSTGTTYMESVKVFLQDARGRQVSCALFNKRVGFKQLIDIKLTEPARLYANITYKLIVELNKRGWYPMGTYSKHTNVSAGVLFTFCVGDPTESFRDCIIRSILFSEPMYRRRSRNFDQPSFQEID
ncbi:BTB/POZ domain-containing protein 6-B-like isoform X2 [Homalodisca vitripennis]|uniref:BTB/POZ domain-containing protein 6-B-like isoform X2 n=1 Tax=Homalodisca vitripennis TaxID=197043 RepID=UPI001EEB0B2F|nr:BTB/POZ domain-containing protein 6-B-like isoform X2 [Homalodisca vitripennis]